MRQVSMAGSISPCRCREQVSGILETASAFATTPTPSLPPTVPQQFSSTLETAYLASAFVIIVIIICVIWLFFLRETLELKRRSLAPSQPVSTIKPSEKEDHLGDMMKEELIMFSAHQLKIATNNFREKLGEGACGKVYKGMLEDSEPVAVKVLDGDFSNRLIKSQFKAELNSIRRTHHPNLVKLYGFCFDNRLKALVYEFMENGSLDGFLFEPEKKERITCKTLYNIAVGTAKGIAYLHEECRDRIIHYDIKPENVLLDGEFRPKVSDFGLAALYSRDAKYIQISGFKGTPGYAAPEMWMPFPITEKCDVYSFGMLLFEILGRRRNLDAKTTTSQSWLPRYVWKKFLEGGMEEMAMVLGIDGEDREAAKRMAMVALWCIQHQLEVRPTMSKVVKMLEGKAKVCSPPNPFANIPSFDEISIVSTEASTLSSNAMLIHCSDKEFLMFQ